MICVLVLTLCCLSRLVALTIVVVCRFCVRSYPIHWTRQKAWRPREQLTVSAAPQYSSQQIYESDLLHCLPHILAAPSDAVGAGLSMGPQYSMPPPPYPPLCGAKAKAMGVVNNLMASFVSMAIKPASQPAAEDIPSLDVGSGGGFAAPVDAAAGPRRSAAAGEYGQVMDMGAFVRWLATSGTDSDSLGC